MTKIDLNTSPYFDDYTESKKFYKILFRPGRAIQARELTQIQSIIQNQISRFGKHLFKNFALVSPRPSLGCKYDPTTVFVKIPATSDSRTQTESNLNNYWLNKRVNNQLGVEGLVIGYEKTDNFVRLFISLEKAGTGANNFAKNDILTVNVVDTLPDGTTSVTTTLTTTIEGTTNAVGRIASIEIPDSIYFYEEYFVLVDRQWLFVTPDNVNDDLAWNASPTCEVGIEMIQSKVTFEDDESLLDNATGASNFSAPGADRLKIEGILVVKQLNTTDQNFVKLLTVTKGIITKAWQLETDPYNDPYKAILAKRTFDESGNYTTKPFIVETRPFLATDNKGLFTEEALSVPFESGDALSELLAQEKAIQIAKDVFELTWVENATPKIVAHNGRYYPGTSYGTADNLESFKKLCEGRLGLRFQPGAAYVEGYFQQKSVITNVSIKKSRTSDFLQNQTVQTPKGTQLLIKNVVGLPPIQDAGNSNLSYDEIELHSVVLPERASTPSPASKIGTARVYSISLYSGANGSFNSVYALGIFDVQFGAGYSARDLAAIYYPGGAGTGTFTANMLFKDVTTNPSLRFAGTISKYTQKSVTNVAFAGATNTDLIFDYDTEAERLTAINIDYTPGTFLSITDNTTTVERVVVGGQSSVVNAKYRLSVRINELLPSATFTSPLTKVETIRKVKGVGTLWKSNAGEKLEKGDQVAVGTGDKMRIYTVYSNPSNDNELSLNPDPTVSANAPWDDGSVMNYLVAEPIQDSSLGNAGLVYRLPNTEIRAIRGGTKDSPTYSSFAATYVASRYAVAAKTGGSPGAAIFEPGITYTLPATDERFERGLSNYGLVDLDEGHWFELFSPGTGNVGTIGVSGETPSYRAEVQFSGQQITFNVDIGDSTTNNNRRFGLIVAVEKSQSVAKEGKKTLTKGNFAGAIPSYTGGGLVIPVNLPDTNKKDSYKKISLGIPDILRVTRIVESPNDQTDASALQTLPDGHNDITFKYMLDNGQRDYYYGIAEILLRPGYDAPKGRLRIEFDYFEHTVTGDYFSVDSYPWNSNTLDANLTEVQMTYDEIPEYSSERNGKYDLRSCLDFRPVCLPGNDAVQNGRYAFTVYRELPAQDFTCSYHVYEERRDKIFIDTDGKIKVKYGVPGLIANTPEDPADGLVLYDVQMLPYTEDYRKCILIMRDNRRYTMRDIGKIEERVKNLEYYTSLSLLESDTNNLVIKDALGQDKFKHGFMVDNFANESVSDTEHPDYTAALDKISGELKPRCFDNHIKLLETYSIPSYTGGTSREINNYTLTGGLLTLNYTNVQYMEQPLASRLININPYQVQTFMGILKISPWTDTWRDTVVSEPLVVYDTSAYDFARQQFNQNGEKTDWNGTKTDWQGIDITQDRKADNVLKAGHSWPAKDGKYMSPKTGQLIDGTPKKGQWVTVPPGYANSGEKVRYGHSGSGQEVYNNTLTMKGNQYATGIKSTIVEAGFSAPVSMGTRVIDTRAADHIRSNEIKFEGKCFLPNSKLYAFFDGVDVSQYCIPDVNYGGKLETADAIRRGPYSGLSCEFTSNTLTIKGNKTTDAGDQHKKSDGSDPTSTSRGTTLAGLSYDAITPFVPAPGQNEPDLDFVGCKLTGKVKLLRNDTTQNILTHVKPGDYYLLGTASGTDATIFTKELSATNTQQSVLVIDDLLGEYQVAIGGVKTDTLALISTPYMRSGTGYTATDYMMDETDAARSCVDLLEVLQKLYAKKYVDVSGSATTSHNVNNKEVVSANYIPATGTNTIASLILKLDDKVDFGSTATASVALKVKNRSTDKDIDQGELTIQCDATGKIKGKFVIPDPKFDGNPRFRVGERVFRLTNSPKNEEVPTVSRAEAKYNASGWIDVKQEQLYSTKQFKIDAQYVEGNRTPISLSDTFESAGKVCPRDPLAQSFTVSEETGIFLTAIDVFFFSKDPVLPVILQVRPLDDGGNPSVKLIYEMTLDAEDVVVNKLDLAKQTLTVVGNPNGKDGFNKGPWTNTPSGNNTGVYHVMSKNQATGKNTAAIEHNKPFTYTTLGGVASPCEDMIPTRFVFEYPIYLPGNNTNYAFVLLTDSIQAPGTGVETLTQTYQVYMAQTGAAPITQLANTPTATPIHLLTALEDGEDDYNYILGTTDRLNTIPGSDGVLFKSINGISWESDQKADLKYKLYRAKFNTTRNAQIEFVNEKLSLSPLIYDPFETVEGQSQIRVYHRNHNIPADTGKVRFVGLPSSTSLNGIPYQVLARPEGHTVLNPTLDSYIIELGTSNVATETGRIGGRTVAATGQLRFEEFLLRSNPVIPKDTEITWKFLGTTAKAAYDPDSTPWKSTDEVGFTHNTSIALPQSSMICSTMNEVAQLSSSNHRPGTGNSLKVIAYLSSKSEYISPVLDDERIAVDLKGVRLDDPVGAGLEYNNINNSRFDTIRILPATSTPAVSGAILQNKIFFSDTDSYLTGSNFYYEGKKVRGVGTLFLSELNVGDTIKHPMLDDTRKVLEIISDTEMYINEEFPLSDITGGDDGGGTTTLLYNPPYLRLKTGNSDVAAHLSTLDVGKYISVSNTTSRDFDNKRILAVKYTPTSTVPDVELTGAHNGTSTACLCEITVEHRLKDTATPGLEGSSTFVIKQLNNFIDEIAPMGGSVASKYVGKTMKLKESANTLRVMFDGCRPKNSKIELYYKVGSDSEQAPLDSKNWTKLEYSVETNGVLEEVTPEENPTQLSFSSYEANALQLPPFTLAKIKIVLRGGHTPLYPKMKNLRIIALED